VEGQDRNAGPVGELFVRFGPLLAQVREGAGRGRHPVHVLVGRHDAPQHLVARPPAGEQPAVAPQPTRIGVAEEEHLVGVAEELLVGEAVGARESRRDRPADVFVGAHHGEGRAASRCRRLQRQDLAAQPPSIRLALEDVPITPRHEIPVSPGDGQELSADHPSCSGQRRCHVSHGGRRPGHAARP
jgi:hypothetical protein